MIITCRVQQPTLLHVRSHQSQFEQHEQCVDWGSIQFLGLIHSFCSLYDKDIQVNDIKNLSSLMKLSRKGSIDIESQDKHSDLEL